MNSPMDRSKTAPGEPFGPSSCRGRGDDFPSSTGRNVRECGRSRFGFTILETLVVIAIIAVLVSLLLPAVQRAREGARQMQCRNNLLQIGLALQNYEAAHDCLPPGSVDVRGPVQNNGTGYQVGWMVQILPQLDQQNAYLMFDFSVGVYDNRNTQALSGTVAVYGCPSRGGYAACHHDVEAPIDVDNHGVMFLNSSIRRDDIHDGASHTIFVGEAGAAAGLGWASGTRDSLRSTGSPINGVTAHGAREPRRSSRPPTRAF